MDRAKKLLTMHKAFNPESNIDRPRKELTRRLLNAEDTINTAILDLENYVVQSKERMFSATRDTPQKRPKW